MVDDASYLRDRLVVTHKNPPRKTNLKTTVKSLLKHSAEWICASHG